jgi:hypothetical protein
MTYDFLPLFWLKIRIKEKKKKESNIKKKEKEKRTDMGMAHYRSTK